MGEGTKRNLPCPCGSGKKYKDCCMLIKIPKMGVIRLVYEHGTNDPFIARMLFQILEIRNFIYKGDSERKQFDNKHMPVFQNLLEARMVKEKAYQLIKEHTEKISEGKICQYDSVRDLIHVNETIENELSIYFKDFFIRGNMVFRDLIRLAGFMGYNISFAFSDKKKYTEKKNKFLIKNPEEKFNKFCDMIDNDRKAWQSIFVKIRDTIEHEGFKLPEIKYVIDGSNNSVKPLYPKINNQTIEEILEICWSNLCHFYEEIIVFLLSVKLTDPLILVAIPKDKRDPNNPVKYKVGAKD